MSLGDIVQRIPDAGDKPIGLEECRSALLEAHDYLVLKGRGTLARAYAADNTRYWGTEIKRIRVPLPQAERPHLVAARTEEHSLAEVTNQCATIERLLDVLEWAQTKESGLADSSVERCHPTTSSSPREEGDHDLVLSTSDGTRAKFEVSDVSGDRDGNNKEKKDLIALGVLRAGVGSQIFTVGWPAGRLFLGISPEFARRLLRPTRAWLKGTPPHCRYSEVANQGTTIILEVSRGAEP